MPLCRWCLACGVSADTLVLQRSVPSTDDNATRNPPNLARLGNHPLI